MEKPSCKLLLVDDSDEDRLRFQVAFWHAKPLHLRLLPRLASCDDVCLYLGGEGRYSDRLRYPFPDLLLLDLKMPGKGGFDVLKFIRQRKLRLFTIISSDSRQHHDIARAISLGANDYLQKLSNLFDIADCIRMLDDSAARWVASQSWSHSSTSPPCPEARGNDDSQLEAYDDDVSMMRTSPFNTSPL